VTAPPPPAEARREQAVHLRRRYDDGASVQDLEQETGLSHGTVLNRLRQAGTAMRTPAQTRQLHAGDAQTALGLRFRTRYEAGATVETLAEEEGLSARTVRRRLTEAATILRSAQESRRLAAGATNVRSRQRLATDLRRRYEAGEGVPALAAAYGKSPSTVYRLLHAADTVMRPQHHHGPGERKARPP